MSNYWQDRFDEQQVLLFDMTYEETQKILAKYYTNAIKDIKEDITKLYAFLLEHSEDGQLIANDLFTYDRYFQTMNQIQARLYDLGRKECVVLDREMYRMWDRVRDELVQYGPPVFKHIVANPDAAKAVIDSVWCADGKHWSERVYQHKEQLQEAIQKGLMDCVARGANVDTLALTIANEGQISWHNAQRIARTELCHIQVQSTLKGYIDAGFEYYQFWSMEDDKTCKGDETHCEELRGKIFPIMEAQTGVNLPPIHPNCRCTIIPIVKGVNDKL